MDTGKTHERNIKILNKLSWIPEGLLGETGFHARQLTFRREEVIARILEEFAAIYPEKFLEVALRSAKISEVKI
jgi:hypothetical protein